MRIADRRLRAPLQRANRVLGAAEGPFRGPDSCEQDIGSHARTRQSQLYALLVGRLTDETRRQEVLVRAALILTSELSLPVVLQKIADLACEVADARYGALGVIGRDGRLSDFVTHGLSDEQRQKIGRLPEGHGLLGVLINEAKPLRLRRIQDHPLSSGFPANHPPMNSLLGVPIAIRGKVFGNLYLTEKENGEGFNEGDEDAVTRLAAQAAVAVENARLYEEAQIGQRRLAAVNEVARSILEGHDIDDVLSLIASRARELVGARVATVVTPRRGAGDLIVRVAEGEQAEDLGGMTFAADSSVSDDVMRAGTALVLADASVDPRVSQPFVRAGKIGPALFAPMTVGDRSFGTLALGNRSGERQFTDEDLALLEAFAAQAAVALEHARIQEELQRLALVEDRERIAKELHDDIVQSLFAEGMALQASLSMLDDPNAMELRITTSVERIDRVIRDLRNYIFALRPGAAADRALARSLADVATNFAEASGVEIDVTVDDRASSTLAGKTANILQAAREAISNAVRHSGGDRVRVSLSCSTDMAVLEVSDSGKGFDLADAKGRGNGLTNLQERANDLEGELDIESEPGRGTWVRLRIPI